MGRYLIRISVADPAVPCRSLVAFLSLIILLSEFLRVRVIWPLHSWWEDIPSVTVRLLLVSMSCCQCSDLCVTPYVPTCSSAFATHTINTPAAKGNWRRQTIIFSSLHSHMQNKTTNSTFLHNWLRHASARWFRSCGVWRCVAWMTA